MLFRNIKRIAQFMRRFIREYLVYADCIGWFAHMASRDFKQKGEYESEGGVLAPRLIDARLGQGICLGPGVCFLLINGSWWTPTAL